MVSSNLKTIAENSKDEGVPVILRDPSESEVLFFGKVPTVAEITEDFTFQIFPDQYITIHAGFVTDGASIPRFAWLFIGHPFGKYFKAALAHDWLCRTAESYDDRCTADAVFRGLLRADGVGYVRRLIMYRTLEIAARWEWRITPEQKEKYRRFG